MSPPTDAWQWSANSSRSVSPPGSSASSNQFPANPLSGGDFDWNAGILAAAKELGSLGADLYKAEVPFKGQAPEADVRAACAELTNAIDGPWVVLSSGVPEDVFPDAVRWACLEGASGFLSGRAVWASCIGAPDVVESLSTDAVRRLQRLCAVVDDVVSSQKTSA